MTISASSTYSSLGSRLAGSTQITAEPTGKAPTTTVSDRPDGTGPAVIVSLSRQALSAMSSAPMIRSPYASFFPTRDGYSGNALADATSDPGTVGSSAGKSFSEVAKDARERMDTKYAAMRQNGQPYGPNSMEGRDRNTLMGDLDRRSLYAVSSNEGHLFTKDEQDAATSLMRSQQGLAMGLYSGPISQQAQFHDQFAGNERGRYEAGITFLQNVSPEEKQSGEWMQQRMSLEQMAARQSDAPVQKTMTLLDMLIENDKKQNELKDGRNAAAPADDHSGNL